MFDLVRNNKKFVQIFLLLITLPFAFWGVESYVRSAASDKAVAEVGGSPIRPVEFQQALREQQDRMRKTLGSNYNPAMLETPAARAAVLDNLINQRLLSLHAAKMRVSVSDQLLRDTIAGVPAFQENGQFSTRRYQAALQAQGMNEAMFESRVRQDLAFQQLIGAVADGSIAARASAERVLAVQLEERDISQVVLAGKQFESQVKLADGAAKGFYDTNRKRFELPAQVRADFLVLNQDALADQVTVSDAEAKKWYDEHPERYRQGEERRASHILILADKSAPEAAHKAAREKAEALLKQARANPAAFATLAKANSQDPGSAQNGGDLGFFARGAMVKAFEDVAFALKDGQISDVVRSDYGYHIIKLTGIKASKAQPFEAVKGDILTELKRVQAGKKFAELAETFSNTVYEQADSLKPAADKFKLAIQHTGWIARGAQVAPPFNNEKLITALFSEDALKNKRNTDAVDVGNNTLVAARVAEYKPATLRPFEEVKADIERMLVAEEAAKLAAKDGAAKLASLQKGDKLELAWTEGRKLQRGAPSLPPEAMRAVFSAPADKLPAYTGLNLPGAGYVLFRIEKVNHPAVQESDPRLQAIRTQYGRLLSDQDFSAYMSALRQRYGVKIDKAQLESKEK